MRSARFSSGRGYFVVAADPGWQGTKNKCAAGGIMGLLDRLFGRPTKEEQQKLDRAEQMGRDAAASMVRDLDSFFAIRFGHIKEAYLDILRQNMVDDIGRVDHSPLLLARADYSIFLENVAEAIPRMKEEILAHMSEWQATFAKMGMETDIERVADARLSDFQLDMTTSGLTILTDSVDELKAADDAWRLAHPEQAAKEQLPD